MPPRNTSTTPHHTAPHPHLPSLAGARRAARGSRPRLQRRAAATLRGIGAAGRRHHRGGYRRRAAYAASLRTVDQTTGDSQTDLRAASHTGTARLPPHTLTQLSPTSSHRSRPLSARADAPGPLRPALAPRAHRRSDDDLQRGRAQARALRRRAGDSTPSPALPALPVTPLLTVINTTPPLPDRRRAGGGPPQERYPTPWDTAIPENYPTGTAAAAAAARRRRLRRHHRRGRTQLEPVDDDRRLLRPRQRVRRS